MTALVTIQFVVPAGHREGDYAKLHSNGGSGDIDWNSPVDNNIYPLFPQAKGIAGFGHAPFGNHRFGKAHSTGPLGFGQLPFGNHPFGLGTALVTATDEVTECGSYKYGFACYDEFGNQHEGTPEEAELNIHMAPEAPEGLKKKSYNKTNDVLILETI